MRFGYLEVNMTYLINMLSTRMGRRLNVASAVVAMMFMAFSASGLYAQGYGTMAVRSPIRPAPRWRTPP